MGERAYLYDSSDDILIIVLKHARIVVKRRVAVHTGRARRGPTEIGFGKGRVSQRAKVIDEKGKGEAIYGAYV